jgi:hypothetical protein
MALSDSNHMFLIAICTTGYFMYQISEGILQKSCITDTAFGNKKGQFVIHV